MLVTLRDGLRLRVREAGVGDPLLLLHGFTGSSESWGEPLVAGLAERSRVLAVDLPGHGASDAPVDPGRYALEAVVADLCDLLDATGTGSATWVGYSMGGRIALGAAVLAPGRVRRLVLESASPGLSTEEERSARRFADAALARRIRAEGIAWFVDKWERLPPFATQARLPAGVLAAQRERRLANDPAALAACLGGLGTGSQPSFWEDLAGVRAPTLLLAGAEDLKFREIGRRMADGLPAARLEVAAGAGHAVHLEAPAAWLAAVRGFLAETGGEAES
ncbi:MAG: 2-succinyl-6-hydroxy-2,4-cyclohexadiene-1-carboxylate synthase [Gemmatimonadota bacterium]